MVGLPESQHRRGGGTGLCPRHQRVRHLGQEPVMISSAISLPRRRKAEVDWRKAAGPGGDAALPATSPVVEAVLARLPMLPSDAVVLDLACGVGQPSFVLARDRPGVEVHGVDVTPALIDQARFKARENAVRNVRFDVMSVDRLKLADESVQARTAPGTDSAATPRAACPNCRWHPRRRTQRGPLRNRHPSTSSAAPTASAAAESTTFCAGCRTSSTSPPTMTATAGSSPSSSSSPTMWRRRHPAPA